MGSIEIKIEGELGEARKVLSFLSEDIVDFRVSGGTLTISTKPGSDDLCIAEKAERALAPFLRNAKQLSEKILSDFGKDPAYVDERAIFGSGLVTRLGDGLIQLNDEALALFDFFDAVFSEIAELLGAIEKRYPVLLPREALRKTGYLRTSPQCLIYCCAPTEDEDRFEEPWPEAGDLGAPRMALSPAACFHTYLEYENRTLDKPSVFTFIQSVFREEGRFNWVDFGRLRDYHVREIVFFGDESYVLAVREAARDRIEAFLRAIGMRASISVAYDMFVKPDMQRYKKLQLAEENKYEVRLNFGQGATLAAASLNRHTDAFTHPFNISIAGIDKPHSGCVGFGLERWVLAFLAQFGVDPRHWPSAVNDFAGRRVP